MNEEIKSVGKNMEFKVVKINEEFRNVVVSHKALIEAELEEQKKQIISGLLSRTCPALRSRVARLWALAPSLRAQVVVAVVLVVLVGFCYLTSLTMSSLRRPGLASVRRHVSLATL